MIASMLQRGTQKKASRVGAIPARLLYRQDQGKFYGTMIAVLSLLAFSMLAGCNLPYRNTTSSTSETTQETVPLEPSALPLISTTPATPSATREVLPLQFVSAATPGSSDYASLIGKVFFDRNGDARQDEGEAGIGGAQVCADSSGSALCAWTKADGAYRIEGVPQGEQPVSVTVPSNSAQFAFRYIATDGDYTEVPAYYINNRRVGKQILPEAGVRPIEKPVEVKLDGDAKLDFGLMQGYLTDPFACRDRERITIFQGYDLDRRPGEVRNYLGETRAGYGVGNSGRTVDNHAAIDWGSSNQHIIGIPVRAAAAGIVVFAGIDVTPHGDCRMVSLVHPDTGHATGYVHLDEILVEDGQEVLRGQILGTLGKSCTDWPHLHFTFNTGWEVHSTDSSNRDPFRDLRDSRSVTWWTQDNEPVCWDW